jgi:hypothetical protein
MAPADAVLGHEHGEAGQEHRDQQLLADLAVFARAAGLAGPAGFAQISVAVELSRLAHKGKSLPAACFMSGPDLPIPKSRGHRAAPHLPAASFS